MPYIFYKFRDKSQNKKGKYRPLKKSALAPTHRRPPQKQFRRQTNCPENRKLRFLFNQVEQQPGGGMPHLKSGLDDRAHRRVEQFGYVQVGKTDEGEKKSCMIEMCVTRLLDGCAAQKIMNNNPTILHEAVPNQFMTSVCCHRCVVVSANLIAYTINIKFSGSSPDAAAENSGISSYTFHFA